MENSPSLEDVLRYVDDLKVNREQLRNPASAKYRPFDADLVWVPTVEYARYLVRKNGPAKAMAQIEHRAASSIKQLEMHDTMEQRKVDAERRRRERERQDALELSEGMSVGERINKALAELSVVAEGKSQSFGEIVKGGGEKGAMPVGNGPAELRKAQGVALHAARKIERMVERAKRSPLPPPKLANRDDKLRALVGYSPREIALMDPSQGLERQIMERREKMGLDPQTGDELLDAA